MLLLGVIIPPCYTDVVNGNVNTDIIYDASRINVSSDLDQGWHARSASLYDLSYHDIWSTSLMNQSGYWVGQIFSDNYDTHDIAQLSFDINYVGKNIQFPTFQYTIFGTDATDVSNTSLVLDADSNPAGSAWALIGSGSVSTPSNGNYEVHMDLGSSTYKYMSVRFRFTGTTIGRGTDYATAVDNVSFVNDSISVPEPAVIGLIGIGGIITLAANRLKRNRPSNS